MFHPMGEKAVRDPVLGELINCRSNRAFRAVSLARKADRGSLRSMRELLILVIHLVVTFAKLLQPGGACAVAADLSSAKIESNRF